MICACRGDASGGGRLVGRGGLVGGSRLVGEGRLVREDRLVREGKVVREGSVSAFTVDMLLSRRVLGSCYQGGYSVVQSSRVSLKHEPSSRVQSGWVRDLVIKVGSSSCRQGGCGFLKQIRSRFVACR